MKTKKIVILTIIIVLFGLVNVYSSSHVWALYKYDDVYYFIKRQVIFAILGFVGMYITSRIDYHIYKTHYKKIIIVCFVLLGLVLIPGLGVVRGGSRSWFNLGVFALQPSELFKIGMIIFAAVYIEKNYYHMHKLRYSFPVLGVMGLGFLLIMLQPDFGSGIVMACSIVVMLIVSPFPFVYFIGLGMFGCIGDCVDDFIGSVSHGTYFIFFRSFSRSIRKWISSYSIFICNRAWRTVGGRI